MGMMINTEQVRKTYINAKRQEYENSVEQVTAGPLLAAHAAAADDFDAWRESQERRLVREEKKSAAANRENERLRAEVRRLRTANFALQSYIDNPASQTGYKIRYEKLQEAVNMALDILPRSINGLPVEPPQTMEPARVPAWARVKPEN